MVSPGYVDDNHLTYDMQQFNQMSEKGKTVVFVLIDDALVGMIALADMVRETAKEAIAKLKEIDIHSIMLTGDNKKVANWVAEQLNIDEYMPKFYQTKKRIKLRKLRKKAGGWQ